MTRIGAQVITGLGFIGAGTIIVTRKHTVKGLTTAAGLWACACLGLAAGTGYLFGTLVALGFVLFTFVIIRRIDRRLNLAGREFDLYIELDTNRNVKHLLHRLRSLGINYSQLRVRKSAAEGDGPLVTMHVTIGRHSDQKRQDIVDIVNDVEYVYYAEDF